ncbi:MAG: S-methyl-5-thioribose-1-phosphate isomerase [Candidatus Saganbacteria bacterium]|nr:S-methyl-5-thioribose-1-phosphate isomerase [Candidatus Saganbacteria bacterium]
MKNILSILVLKDYIKVLDQNLLPFKVKYVTLKSLSDVILAIKNMTVRGAPLIGIVAAFGLAFAWRQVETAPVNRGRFPLKQAAKQLKASRPTAVNLAWAVDRLVQASKEKCNLWEEAKAIMEEEKAACDRMGRKGAKLIKKGSRILTICNTGSLATYGDGTALGVIREAYRQGKIKVVYASETRPRLQGARLTVWELKQSGIPHFLITDNMAAHLMQRGEIDCVIAGADRIAANGDSANKIGTYSLAVLAKYHNIPFYIVAPASTIDKRIKSGKDIPIEERSSDEVLMIKGQLITLKGTKVKNPAFDVTPRNLITAIITD